jgi:type IV pilus assembly protein PilM
MIGQFFKKPQPLMVGIDIGSHSVKAVLLNQKETHYRLEAFAIEPMPKGAMVERTIQDIEAVGRVINKIRKKLSKNVTQAATAVSGQAVITKVIFMDVALTDAELESQIEIEADSLIPYPLEEVSIDFETLDVNDTDPSKVNVLLSAARTESIEARAGAIESGGLIPKVVDVESYALSRNIELCLNSLPDDASEQVVAFIDVGATMTLISVVQGGHTLYTRDQNFGGEQYTNSIVSYYNKSFDEAEFAKTAGDLPPNYTFEVLAPFQTSFLQQVRRAIQMFLTTSGKEQVDYIVLSGGTSLIFGLDKLLIDELGVHSIIMDPFEKMELAPSIDRELLEKQKSQLAVATGLALRSFSSCHI